MEIIIRLKPWVLALWERAADCSFEGIPKTHGEMTYLLEESAARGIRETG